mmetsp:Transcript_6852/g.12065  ORF Transcript_6852/g.12065 Transcript_6852/m.12065 type:complete len:226 (+) Transcript_6852:700-1377(+)
MPLIVLMMSPGLQPASAALQDLNTDLTTAPDTQDLDSHLSPVGCLSISTSNSSPGAASLLEPAVKEIWPLVTLSGKLAIASPSDALLCPLVRKSSKQLPPSTLCIDCDKAAVDSSSSSAPLGKITGPAPGLNANAGPRCTKKFGSNTTAPGPFSTPPASSFTRSRGQAGALLSKRLLALEGSTAAMRSSIVKLTERAFPRQDVSPSRSRSAGCQASDSSPSRIWQ